MNAVRLLLSHHKGLLEERSYASCGHPNRQWGELSLAQHCGCPAGRDGLRSELREREGSGWQEEGNA